MSENDALQNWILDGFPRTIGQGELLDTHLNQTSSPLSLVVHLDVPDEIILKRISGAFGSCSKCSFFS